MSSPFMVAEPVSIEKPKQDKKPEPKPMNHPEVNACVGFFSDLIEDTNNQEKHINFIKCYLDLLSNNNNDMLSVLSTVGESENDNIFSFIYSNSQQMSWGLFEFFVTVVNLCSQISQNKDLTHQQKFVLYCIMLTNNNDSPVFSYTELLHKYKESNNEMYEELNSIFLEQYNLLSPKIESNESIQKVEEELEKSEDDKKNKSLDFNFIFIIIALVVVLLACLIYNFIYKNNNSSCDLLHDF